MFSFDYSAVKEDDQRVKNVELGEGFMFLKREPVRPGQFFQRPDRTEKSVDVISLSEGNKSTVSPILDTECKPLEELVTTSGTCEESCTKDESTTLLNHDTTFGTNELAEPFNLEYPLGLSRPDPLKVSLPLKTAIQSSRPSKAGISEGTNTQLSPFEINPAVFNSRDPTNRRDSVYSDSPCGDLEPPGLLQPPSKIRDKKSRNTSWEEKRLLTKMSNSRRRSQSCASNMSKKRRSTGITERLTLTNEKKAAAMNKVAQNWNTCMQIAAEEQNIASKEIFKLKQSIRQQDIELDLANGNYQRSQSRVDDLENQLQDMQKKYAAIENEKLQLEEGSRALEQQLQDSCDRVNKVEEKCGIYKDKLNETIQEQQDLHKLSQHRCDELQTQLSQLLEERDVHRSEIDKALSESQAKKEELSSIVAAVKDEISREREKGDIRLLL